MKNMVNGKLVSDEEFKAACVALETKQREEEEESNEG
jgi:hypothetical protein